MAHEETGLPCDSIDAGLRPSGRRVHTSPTNVAGYLWSAICARDLGLIPARECRERLAVTLGTLARLRRHVASGMFANWYAADTGEVITRWPNSGRRVIPFVSSVDNGWLAATLLVVAAAEPALAEPARHILDRMRFDALFDPEAGRLRGGFWDGKTLRKHVVAAYGPIEQPLRYTAHHYGLLNSEPRLTSYVGIVLGQLPPSSIAAVDAPVRTYRGRTVVATCGGSMFEALSPELFVPEADWAPATWGANHADTVALQREYGLDDKRYGLWGFSPCANPGGGYAEWGVPPIAWLPRGYPSKRRGEAVVTPHASALAMMHDPEAASDNLRRIAALPGAFGPGGFVDSVGIPTGRRAERHLAIDQAMLLGALATRLADGGLRRWFCSPPVSARLRPLVRGALPAQDATRR